MTEDLSSSTHPPLPPTTEDDRLVHLRLLRSRRVGPVTYRRLLAEHGSARAALDALPAIALEAGVTGYTPCSEADALAEWQQAARIKAVPLFLGDPAYPALLADIDTAPPLLWLTGDASLLTRPLLSVIGARDASSLGSRMAQKLARELGEAGFVIVSGLARGIDAAAHQGALATGTLAIMASGVDVLVPAQNAGLGQQIGEMGLRLSDQPPGLAPLPRHFVARNRIITGLSRATVVVEAAARSGSLAAARGALDQGREVMAVPGHPFEPRAAGCNMLLRDGAILLRGAQDVLEHIGDPSVPAPQPPRPAPPTTGAQSIECAPIDLSDAILNALDPDPMQEDAVIRAVGLAPTAVAPVLVDLELDGRIVRQAGGMLARVAG